MDLLRRSSYLHGTLVSRKIKEACAIALADGYRYIWIDSCCIDKSSSSELSEAINSMFNWYSNAAICYAYLVDVPDDDDPHVSDSGFSKSRWFRRGWTLQELIAPKIVVFFSSSWRVLGTKSTLASVIAKKTNIPPTTLFLQEPLHTVSVAARMSWASRRTCTRVEDHAYSLLGIFDINMPTLYGEGSRAFMRLQEEILKKIPDQSLFAWGRRAPRPRRHVKSRYLRDQLMDPQEPGIQWSGIIQRNHRSLLAHSPAYFAHGSHHRHIPHATFLRRLGISDLSNTEYTPTPYGIRTQLPCVSLQAFPDILHQLRQRPMSYTEQWYLAILAVEVTGENHDGGLLARICFMDAPPSVSAPIPLESGYCQGRALPGVRGSIAYPLIALSSHALDLIRNEIVVLTVMLCSEPPAPSVAKGKVKTFSNQSGPPIPRLHCPASVRAALELAGFDMSFFLRQPKNKLDIALYRITISDRSGYSISVRAVFCSRLLCLEELSVTDGDDTDGGVLPASARKTILPKVFFRSSRRYEALQIRLPATGGKNRTLRLTVEHYSARPCHYLLDVELLSDGTSPKSSRSDVGTSECDGGGSAVHGDVDVALSGPAVGIDKDTTVEDGGDHGTVEVEPLTLKILFGS